MSAGEIMDKQSVVIKTVALWGGLTIAFPALDATALICALLGAGVFVTYSYKKLTTAQTVMYFLTSSVVGYLVSGEMADYFAFPYRNTVAFMAGALCLAMVAAVHRMIPAILRKRLLK